MMLIYYLQHGNYKCRFLFCHFPPIYAVPSFTNFTEDSKSTEEVSVTWDLESPGVRPVQQVIVRWMEENDRTQLPSPGDFPLNNSQIFDSPSQTFSCNFTGLSSAQRYVVLIQGTNLVGTSNTYFVIETGKSTRQHSY